MSLRTRNERGRFSKPMNVRSEPETKEAEKLIKIGPVTFVLVYADWCHHCHDYMPTWKDFEDMPNRSANIIKVHHDMLEKIPTIANAKIQGYPSVIKVLPNGKIEEYSVPGKPEKTNAMPEMRNIEKMRQEITEVVKSLSGGALASVSSAFVSAFQQAGPAALLLAAHNSLPKPKSKSRTFKSPKKANRRASTRKNRR
jgi:thiol-disulfide isomerase/thioredoxin